MAIAVDASSPVRFTGTWHVTNGGSITSASFTAPADALLVLCGEVDSNDGAGARPVAADLTASDSGGLSWTQQVARAGNEAAANGMSAIFTARTTSEVARTVSLVGGVITATDWGTGRASAKLYVLTGVDVDGTPVDTVGASNEGGSTANSLVTTSVTPGANGLLIAADTDWNALGTYDASADLTQDTAHYTGAISVCDGYKACTSGVGVTANLNAGGTSEAQHKWCQIVVREAAGGAAAGDDSFVFQCLGVQ